MAAGYSLNAWYFKTGFEPIMHEDFFNFNKKKQEKLLTRLKNEDERIISVKFIEVIFDEKTFNKFYATLKLEKNVNIHFIFDACHFEFSNTFRSKIKADQQLVFCENNTFSNHHSTHVIQKFLAKKTEKPTPNQLVKQQSLTQELIQHNQKIISLANTLIKNLCQLEFFVEKDIETLTTAIKSLKRSDVLHHQFMINCFENKINFTDLQKLDLSENSQKDARETIIAFFAWILKQINTQTFYFENIKQFEPFTNELNQCITRLKNIDSFYVKFPTIDCIMHQIENLEKQQPNATQFKCRI